ncbi:MAG: response regulator, partial [Deltaproteobacteria bacterium]|nr:response regulator [Deltaproteobacteria bacterium]
MRGLIVEDEFITRMIMKKILEQYGEIDIAVNGREGVAAFQMAWSEDRPYDLICLDVMMPLMNG